MSEKMMEEARRLLAEEYEKEAAENERKGYANAASNCRVRAKEILAGQREHHALRAIVTALSSPTTWNEAIEKAAGVADDFEWANRYERAVAKTIGASIRSLSLGEAKPCEDDPGISLNMNRGY